MANLIIQIPDEVARRLERIAAAQHKTVQQLAAERLCLVSEANVEFEAGSPSAVLRAMTEPPFLSASDVAELDAAIAAAKMPIRTRDLFPE